MFDAAIVGAGPAGLSAAINLKQLGKDFIWFGSAGGGKVAKSELIANYPGLGLISGGEMDRRFAGHAAALGIAPEDKLVTGIMPLDGKYMLLAENQVYEARAVILATGAVAAKGLPGEQEYLGRGVSYCATCDGFLYRGKRIAVLCASPRYEHEAAYLAQLAEETFFWPAYPASALGGGGLTRLSGPIARILGQDKVTAIVLADGTEIAVDGVFCLRSAVAPAVLLPGLPMDGPHIDVDRQCRTGLAGCFAAGDCTGRPYQIAKAVGEGNVAAHALAEYLADADKA